MTGYHKLTQTRVRYDRLLDEFIAMQTRGVVVTGEWPVLQDKNQNGVKQSLDRAIKRLGMKDVHAVVKDGKLYLVRLDLEEEV
jgi:hypothetical protein